MVVSQHLAAIIHEFTQLIKGSVCIAGVHGPEPKFMSGIKSFGVVAALYTDAVSHERGVELHGCGWVTGAPRPPCEVEAAPQGVRMIGAEDPNPVVDDCAKKLDRPSGVAVVSDLVGQVLSAAQSV
jgi:hypothetical protein